MATNETAKATVYLDGKQAETALNSLAKEAEHFQKQMKEALSEGDMKKFKTAEKNLASTKKAMGSLRKEVFSVDKVMKNLSGATLNDLEKAFRKTRSEMRRMSKTDSGWEDKRKQAQQLSSQIKKVKTEMGTIMSPSQKLISKAKGILPAFGWGAVIAGTIQAGKALYNLANQTQKYREQVGMLTGLEGQALADLTANITASATTFNKEVSEMALANNSLAKSFNISNQEAQDLIDQGFIRGADANGDFLEQLKEYPAQFKAAGLSAEESISLITQQVKSGVFSDKGVDSIKEATIRLREMTPATKAALDQIGISSDELEKKLKEGTITYAQAIGQVSEKLNELPEQSTEVGTAIADIFGGPGEDAGLDYIKTLKDIGKGLDEVEGSTTDNQKAQAKLLEANKKLQKAWSDLMGTGTGTFTNITASAKMLLADGIMKLMSSLRGIQEWFINAYNDSEPFRYAMQTFFAIVKTGISFLKMQLKTLWDSLVGGTKLLLSLFTFDKGKIKAAYNDLITSLKDDVVDFGEDAYNNFKTGFERASSGEKLKLPAPEVETASGKVETVFSEVSDTNNTSPVESKEDKLKRETEALKQAQAEQMNAIKEQRALELISQQEYDALVLEQKALALEQEKALLEQFGQDTTEIEAEILDNKIYNLNQEEKEKDKLQKQKDKELKQEKKLETQKEKIRKASLDNLIDIAGEETAIGQGALVAKQALAVKDAGMAIAVGTAQTAKIGFPQNIPALIAFAAQTAGLIKSIKTAVGSKKEGGYAETSNSDDEAMGVYHANEFIANADAVRNPQVKQVLDIIDVAQKNGTISTIDLPSQLTGQLPGRQNGGYANSESSNSTTINFPSQLSEVLERNAKAIERIERYGVKGVWGYNEYKEGLNKYQDLEKEVGYTS